MNALAPQTWVEIDLGAIGRNYDRALAAAGPDARLYASIKKDAYGHGAVEVARALERKSRLAGFGVATCEEGLALREAAPAAPILLFSVQRGEALEAAVAAGFELTVTDADDARPANEAAERLRRRVAVHLKVDTGMGRLGRDPDAAALAIARIASMPSLRLSAIYTHLADARRDPDGARRQWAKLAPIFRSIGDDAIVGHLGGGDAIGLGPLPRLAALRVGLALYGYQPAVAGLAPAMSFKSRVSHRKRGRAGSRISYGGTHALARDAELAVVGAGYGNGYPTALSNRAEALIGGVRRPVLGRVCMDQFVVDVSESPPVGVGEEVVLIGSQGEATIGADELGERAGSSAYEALCLAGNLNPRILVGA